MLTRRTPLQAKKPLQRSRPIRKKRRGGYKPAKIQFHWNRIAALGCLISKGPATLHHPSASIHGGRTTRDDRCVVPLAPRYHQKVFDPKASDPISVEGLGHRGFFEKYGIDLTATGWTLWAETEALWERMHGKGQIDG